MNKLNVTVPGNWGEMNDKQLYFAYNLIAANMSGEQIKTYCLFKFGEIKMLCKYGDGYLVKHAKQEYMVNALVITQAIQALNFLEDMPEQPVRISKIKRYKAHDPLLKDMDFQSYLYVENLYQGFLVTQRHDMLNEMGQMLYDSEKLILSQAEKMSVFYWWTALKTYFARQFPHLFKQGADENENLLGENTSISKKMHDSMNNQIRALTKGDITKENEVLKMPTWRALTELDNLAREAEELNRKLKKK